ncbi:MAG: zinc ribbon domain-containing protein [Candidatus Aureabacteria bacterium]|nr:zinc ribbon domain-containing protein [Candidatus Auribacterota bacterium]
MPTYEYECLKCGEIFELFQSIKAEALKKHASCGGKVKRLISGGAGIIFKGSGFYETDYRRKTKPPTATKQTESKSPSKSEGLKKEFKPSGDNKKAKPANSK